MLYPLLGTGSFTGFALFMGAAMAITAFPVLARILTEAGYTGRASAPWRSRVRRSTTSPRGASSRSSSSVGSPAALADAAITLLLAPASSLMVLVGASGRSGGSQRCRSRRRELNRAYAV